MDERTARSHIHAAVQVLLAVMVVLALAGCGIGGDDDGDATETAVIATDTADAASTSTTATEAETESAPNDGTEPADTTGATPGAASPTPGIVVSAPPVIMPTPPPPVSASPQPIASASPVSETGDIVTGDGTGGPAGSLTELATPVTSEAMPAAESVTIVTSCTIGEPPSYTGDTPTLMTTIDVNFRAGPGTDCDAIGEPIGPGVVVDVLSDPVQRQSGEFTWVAVSLDGEQGWLATEFLEPTSE